MIYMIGSNYDGCNYVRIKLPAYTNGFDTDIKSIRGERDEMRNIIEDVRNSDVVVFHRPELEEYHTLADELKKMGKKIVMDNDDTFYIDDNHPLAGLSPEGESVTLIERIDCINRFIKKADLVTTSTETLANEYRNHSDNVIVLPNCVDPDDWDEPLRNEEEKIRIGLVGSAAFEYDYLHLKDLIRELSERDDVELYMFGLGNREHREKNPLVTKVFKDEYNFWDTINFTHFPWVKMMDYQTALNEMRLDMMLIPRKDNYFNRCKSNVKFLEASMCEIPVLAQSFTDAPYEEITPDMGVLIKDNKDWKPQIERLIKDKELRRSMGRKAREYVLKNYNINDKAHLWDEEYSKLYDTNN